MTDLSKLTSEQLESLITSLYKKIGITDKTVKQKEVSKKTGLKESTITKLKSIDNYDDEKSLLNYIRYAEQILNKYQLGVEIAENGKFIIKDLLLEENDFLKRLATKLACNLVDVSTSFEEYDEPHEEIIHKKSLDAYRENEIRERFILVTGAGISHEATKKHMPLAKKAIDTLRNKVIGDDKTLNILVNEELENLSLSLGLNKEDFETQLLALSKYSQARVIEGLKDICDIKYLPSIEYEILAHLIKNRLIDIAINFNVDELFDNILKEEISKGDFKYIFSNNQCPNLNEYQEFFSIDNKLREPVYIKPHGTINNQGSLRFTKNINNRVPLKLAKTIKEIINAPIPDFDGQKNLRTNFIIIGFGMKSPLLLETIKNHLDRAEKKEVPMPYFWFFDIKDNIKDFKLELNERQEELISNPAHFFPISVKHNLATHMRALWDLVELSFKKHYKPKGIQRHELINKIFNFSTGEIKKMQHSEKTTDLSSYLKDRIIVEIILTLLTSDGIINLNQMMEGRIGEYLYELNNLEQENSKTTLATLCENIGLVFYKGIVKDAFTLNPPEDFYDSDLYKNLYKKLVPLLSTSKRKRAINEEDFTELAKKVKTRNLLSINPQFIQPYQNIFPSLTKDHILNTGVKWLYNYRKFLKNKKWDLILAVSEKGRFISKDETLKKYYRGKAMELILSSFDDKNFPDIPPNEDRFEGIIKLSDELQFVPWWLHNKHMVIFLSKNKKRKNTKNELDNWTIEEGYYYESRMLSRKVNPIRITDSNDLKTLFNMYVIYWYRAKHYSAKENKKSEEKTIPIIPNKEKLRLKANELLELYYERFPE